MNKSKQKRLKSKFPIYGDKEYQLVCDYGSAPVENLKQALLDGNIDPNGNFTDNNLPFPIIGAMIGFGMVEHVKLLLENGANVNALFQDLEDRDGEEILVSYNLAEHCLTSMEYDHDTKRGKWKSKLVILKLLEEYGLAWWKDQEHNILHKMVGKDLVYNHNKQVNRHLLNNSNIRVFDHNPESGRYFIDVAISNGYYKEACKAIKLNFSMEKRTGNFFISIARNFEELNGDLIKLTKQLLLTKQGKVAYEEATKEEGNLDSYCGNSRATEWQQWKSLANKLYLDAQLPTVPKQARKSNKIKVPRI